MSDSLMNRTVSGLGWSFTENFFSLGINFIIGIILARLLSPHEFGLIGMITVFIAISGSFIDSGFSQALIRKKDCSEEDYSTVFYYNLIIGVIIYIVLFYSANIIADFFREPLLLSLVRVLSLTLIIDSVGIIQRAILIKNINFKLQTKITIIASILSGVVGIYMAYHGYGVWSLIYRVLLLNLITTCLLWLWNKWRPKLLFDYKSFREMFGFGSKLLVSGLIDTVYRNIYYLIIGRYFSATELGFYTRAEQFQNLPSHNINRIVDRVTYPVLSSIQDEKIRLKKGYRRIIKSTMLVSFPLMIGLAAVAKNLIVTLIGNQWLPAVPYLQLMCFAGMLYPLHALNLNILKVKGRSDLFLRLEIIKKVISIPIILIGVYLGIIEMLIGMIVTSLIAYFINSYWSGEMVDYPPGEQLADIAPSFFIALMMGSLVFLVGNLLTIEPVFLLSIQLMIGGIVFIVICELFKVNTYLEIKVIVYDLIQQTLHK